MMAPSSSRVEVNTTDRSSAKRRKITGLDKFVPGLDMAYANACRNISTCSPASEQTSFQSEGASQTASRDAVDEGPVCRAGMPQSRNPGQSAEATHQQWV
ncbi:Protein of unknown function [Gryllus bimaculatus]|nr:Protein of unknown function [Gryllus bimaculatus]